MLSYTVRLARLHIHQEFSPEGITSDKYRIGLLRAVGKSKARPDAFGSQLHQQRHLVAQLLGTNRAGNDNSGKMLHEHFLARIQRAFGPKKRKAHTTVML